jgi:outer membrane protein TolC
MLNRYQLRAILLPLLLTGFGMSLHAQQHYYMSATQAKDFALEHVTDVKNLKIDRKIRESENKELTGQAMPQVTGTLSTQRFFTIPVSLIPDFISPAVYDVLEKENVQDGSGNPVTNPNDPTQYFPAQFGVPWQASAGFAFQQLLFQPDVFVGLQARSNALKRADLNVKVMEDSVKSNVLRSYYGVLIAEKRQVFVEESLSRLEKLHADQEKLYKAGFAEKLDIDKTQVSLNNLQTTKTQLDNLIYIGYASLKYALGMTQKDTLTLTDTLSSEVVKRDLLDGSDFKYEDRSEIQLLNTTVDLQKLDIRRYKLAYIPTIAAYWNFSYNALREDANFLNFKEPWYQTSVAGINMSVPIFDGLQRYNRIKQANFRLEKTINYKENLEKAIDFQREAAVNILKNSLSTLDVQERNMQLAEKVFNTTKKKYEQGLGSSFEILQADQEFQVAQSNYFQALYDAVSAKIGYYRSLGKL